MDEVKRITEVYKRRREDGREAKYSCFNDASLYCLQQREREVLKVLKREGCVPLVDKVILDVGCGAGGELRRFVEYGARYENLFGIDLLPEHVKTAKKLSPQIDFVSGNAETLPYMSEAFDLALLYTVFTSILDQTMKQKVAWEVLRVLKADGMILWYDFWVSNPGNPDVCGVRPKEIKELFPGCYFRFRRLTLAPPIAGLLAKRSWLICYLLEKIPLTRTHYLVTIRKREVSYKYGVLLPTASKETRGKSG